MILLFFLHPTETNISIKCVCVRTWAHAKHTHIHKSAQNFLHYIMNCDDSNNFFFSLRLVSTSFETSIFSTVAMCILGDVWTWWRSERSNFTIGFNEADRMRERALTIICVQGIQMRKGDAYTQTVLRTDKRQKSVNLWLFDNLNKIFWQFNPSLIAVICWTWTLVWRQVVNVCDKSRRLFNKLWADFVDMQHSILCFIKTNRVKITAARAAAAAEEKQIKKCHN